MLLYKIFNKIDKKIYIGQTVQELHIRWVQHKCDANTRDKHSVLHRAMKKHGIKNFEIKALAHCDTMEEMNHREAYYINLFNSLTPNGYNVKLGGNNIRMLEETKKKISIAKKGVKRGYTW